MEVAPAAAAQPASPLSALEVAPALPRTFAPPPGYKLASTYSTAPDFPSFHKAGGGT